MKKKTKRIYIIIISLFLILGLIATFLFFYSKNKRKDYVSFPSRLDEAYTTIIADTDVIGWVMVEGTNIDYPIVNETQATYEGLEDYTWVSNRYYQGENRMAIYGHNVLNVSSQPLLTDPTHTRFEQLLSFVYSDFAKENLYIQITQHSKDELYKIYAVGFVNKWDDYGNSYNYEETEEYIENARENSIYDYDLDVNKDDTIISLVTCTRFFGKSEKTNFRIDARKVRENENIDKYSVTINKNYDIMNLE